MLSNLIICTDASEASDRMVECVKGLQLIGSREAVLVHVLNVRDVGGLYTSLKSLVLPKLEVQQQSLSQAGFKTAIEIPLGFPAFEIHRLAAQRQTSLIVIGSRGESLADEVLLGSTAHSLLQSAVLPVLLIRIEIILEEGGRRCRATCTDFFKHILHPTDFSETAERAFQQLADVVRETKCCVTLLHIQNKVKIDPHLTDRLAEFNRTDAERLERRRAHLLKCGASAVDIQIPFGSPTELILEQARSSRYSLILMGTQGRGFLKEVFLGSVAHNIARHAPLPVLFVPAVR